MILRSRRARLPARLLWPSGLPRYHYHFCLNCQFLVCASHDPSRAVVKTSTLSSFTAVFPECHDALVQRQLAYAKFHGAVTPAHATIPVDEIGHALAHSLFRRNGDFEMQMRLTGIT